MISLTPSTRSEHGPWPVAPEPVSIRAPRVRRGCVVLLGLGVAVALACIVALGVGPVPTSPAEVVRILAASVSGADTSELSHALVITQLRLPRVLVAVVVGFALATAGACMQAYFRNPLAEPGVTGVASGSAVGAVLVVVSGASSAWMLPSAAFCGALAVLMVMHVVSLVSRDRGPTTILLVGVALNAFCGAVTGAVMANAEDSQSVRSAMFWLQGDLSMASWADLGLVVGPVVLGLGVAMLMTRDLNTMMLGDDTAQSMGIDLRRTRSVLLIMTSLLVGVVVAVTGVIGFVGLVAPHMVRLLIGSDHRFLIPGSALLGGLFLVSADAVARSGPGGGSWQSGIVTALVGAPVFLVMVLRSRRSGRNAA